MSGEALRAAVIAAETPLVRAIVKQTFFKQLGLTQLDALDLRSSKPLPYALPALPTTPAEEP
jgi:hypothetical protein